MFRRLSSITLLLASSLVAACGHQVTPNPTVADLSGYMQVKFQTSGALDFTNVIYVVAIDTCGSGVPYPNAFTSGYASYSYAFLVGGGFSSALPELYQYYLNPSSNGLVRLLVPNLNSTTTQFVSNYNGQSNEFELTFKRSDLNNPFNVPFPCPNSASPTPSPSLSPTPTPTVAASVTPTPGASATATSTPTASPTPTPSPTNGDDSTGVEVPPYLTTWTFNFETFATGTNLPLDSLGPNSLNDVSFPGILVYTPSQQTQTFFRPTPNTIPANPAAYITYAEIDNYP